MYRVTLALLSLSEKLLLAKDLEAMMNYLQTDLPKRCSEPEFREAVFEQAFRVRLKTSQLRKWEGECRTVPRLPEDFYGR